MKGEFSMTAKGDTGQGLARGSGTALWRQIAEQLEQQILSGRYAPGDRLPTELVLAQEFGVNRHTLRRAVAELAERGIVRIEQGRGSFVQEDVIDYRVKKRTRFTENILDARRDPSGVVLAVTDIPADEAVAKALEIRKGSMVVALDRLAVVDGRPVCVSRAHFPKARLPGLAAALAANPSISNALAAAGVTDYSRKTTRVTARLARAADARLLQQAPTRPILLAESVNVDGQGRPVEYAVSRWASDRVQLVFEPEG